MQQYTIVSKDGYIDKVSVEQDEDKITLKKVTETGHITTLTYSREGGEVHYHECQEDGTNPKTFVTHIDFLFGLRDLLPILNKVHGHLMDDIEIFENAPMYKSRV